MQQSSRSGPLNSNTFTLNSTYHWGMCPVLVFRSVWCIRKGFITPFNFAYIWSLSSMWPEVGLEVLKSGVGLGTSIILDKRKTRLVRQWARCPLTSGTEIPLTGLLQYGHLDRQIMQPSKKKLWGRQVTRGKKIKVFRGTRLTCDKLFSKVTLKRHLWQ